MKISDVQHAKSFELKKINWLHLWYIGQLLKGAQLAYLGLGVLKNSTIYLCLSTSWDPWY